MQVFRSMRWFLLTLVVALVPASSFAGVFISVGFAPPVLPVYEQPPCPTPGLMWTPGYWAYGDAGYYWVPGAWVDAPYVGALWTPGYWGWSGGRYFFHEGYWGAHVGYYGGVNYGFGYGGIGFAGGMWRGGAFAYNTAVMHVGVGFHSVYEDRVAVEHGFVARDSHVAFSGGPGGIRHDATPEERTAEHEDHRGPSQMQQQHVEAARADHAAGRGYNPNNREANQDQRISNGLRSGQMTSGEAARADRTQSRIDQQVHNDRVENGGKLTGAERQQINGEQNAASRQIYNEKHNGNTVKPNEVDDREANQQQRTAQGLRSGEMTSGEAARSNRNQANLAQTVHNERTANGGALTQQERNQANRQENKNSKQIYNEKHNNATAKGAPKKGGK